MEENPLLDELIRALDEDVDDEDDQVLVSPGSPNPLLDELIRVLDEEDDADHVEDQESGPAARRRRAGHLGDEDAENHLAPGSAEVHREVAVQGSPQSPRGRPLLVRRYMSSSSAKRRITKDDHCNFCHLHLNKTNLEAHLSSSDSCKILYLRRAHLKTVPAVMVTSFGCLYCDRPFNKLQVHLRNTPDCRDQYFTRFSVDSVE